MFIAAIYYVVKSRSKKAAAKAGPRLNFLVIERHPKAQQGFKGVIESLGHSVTVFDTTRTDPASAWIETLEKPYDVLIANLNWMKEASLKPEEDLAGVLSDFKRRNPHGRIYTSTVLKE